MTTPLHYACMNGSLDIVKILIENGADIIATDKVSYFKLF